MTEWPFNGEFGRLEVRGYERQPWDVAEDDKTEIYLMRSFVVRRRIPVVRGVGGHGGGDTRLRDLMFRRADAPAHMRLLARSVTSFSGPASM